MNFFQQPYNTTPGKFSWGSLFAFGGMIFSGIATALPEGNAKTAATVAAAVAGAIATKLP